MALKLSLPSSSSSSSSRRRDALSPLTLHGHRCLQSPAMHHSFHHIICEQNPIQQSFYSHSPFFNTCANGNDLFFILFSAIFWTRKKDVLLCVRFLYIVTFSWVILIEITRIQLHEKCNALENGMNEKRTEQQQNTMPCSIRASSTKLLMVDDLD